jgi:hypothetical protein
MTLGSTVLLFACWMVATYFCAIIPKAMKTGVVPSKTDRIKRTESPPESWFTISLYALGVAAAILPGLNLAGVFKFKK